ncbi:MaoC/PaaZ C-terminal domain-containing protein [Pseudonocardia sp. H11422]|uniref:MaoC/PaaZ C-terminal domain-containing protein n=1 Tax=Pseudonocardia sp. H11422 TaxID=2835866 RepID=UPI001BDD1210|nr:MaoC/PaaZ C-terminal domain-containing protein [Pseudonocardia sp. H11422]
MTRTPSTVRPPVSVNVGDEIPSREIGPVSRTDIVRFAGAGGDFNPLHHDPKFAAKAGFPDVIAMGQLQAGLLAGWLTDWCGVEHLRELEVRFRTPVHLGAVLRFTGEVVELTEEDDEPVAVLDLRASAGDTAVVRAGAVVRRR